MATQETGGTWRFKNVTLMCTGASTHPAQPRLQGLAQLLLSAPAALVATALACIVAAVWWRTCSYGSGGAGSVVLQPPS